MLVQQEAKKLHLPNTTTVTTGASVLLKDINDYLRGGMLTLGGIAVAIMIVILLVLFDVRWRLLPLRDRARRRRLGVRHSPATSASRSRSSRSPAFR